ncbi:phage tail tube protein [Sagittula stellata]|uniref:Uncharacterized protein n=1 Tax=Sagittula stellata (strain ATCC 700073 / DSM 11524 / E-37) TaxID=388399 RepID=A3KA60_SAGS3|nr:phage tail tube protein [Sagittula stellata]EBA06003.1 hypothetical protein SSE37_25383 [Sagittula stellata E-37]
MAIAPTADFDELVLEVEFDPVGSAGTFTKICGITDFTVNRANNTETSEVPDCADESLPHHIKRAVRSQDMTISGTGVWSRTSHQNMMTWLTSASTLNVKITNAAVTEADVTGDTESETIPMILTALNNARTKGQVVSAEISLEQNGAVTRTVITA